MSTYNVRVMKHLSALNSDWGSAVIVALDLELPFPPTDGLFLSALPGGDPLVGPLKKCTYEVASSTFFCEVDPLITSNFDAIVEQHEERGWNTLQA